MSPLPWVDSSGRIAGGLDDVYLPSGLFPLLFCSSRQGVALIADEMGLGKTLQAIVVAAHFFDRWPALVIVPA